MKNKILKIIETEKKLYESILNGLEAQQYSLSAHLKINEYAHIISVLESKEK